ncbi:NAD(P)/FAD-dependent oxidoreductase [Vibrio maerlii]|uniref:NAD(P)/FAD-dependent oxidoreductase n=1 Tax=Vibrio maerlii TaxID=2231648 RepID=UPI000E3DBFDE|nr:NAD(P)/FAD-dependent oxidoreductase [Vibrio maerlii]
MKIAIIGSGISGLTCGYYLHKEHDITVYEANDYVGGHTATIDVQLDNKNYAVDTGFIVYNDRTYPNFIRLLNEIGVSTTPTEMSFSVRNDKQGLEYNGHTIATLFAQKSNLFKPKFYKFIYEIVRFNKLSKSRVEQHVEDGQTLGDFLSENNFSDYFCENYILPMGAAIWSSTLADMRAFPLGFFLRFFLNHGLLDVVNRPQWYVIDGGSRSYIEPLTRGFKDRIRLNSPVGSVTRSVEGVLVESNGQTERYDHVIFASHSNQSLALLSDASNKEQEIFGDMAYQANEVILHTDTELLPKRTAAWAAWNYKLEGKAGEEFQLPTLTYDMNILQHIESNHTFCVSLNCSDKINPDKVLRTFVYDHPVFTTQSLKAQQRKEEINGVNKTWFCGAYWYNGFHEDGVRSALDVVRGIQVLAETHNDEQSQVKGAA